MLSGRTKYSTSSLRSFTNRNCVPGTEHAAEADGLAEGGVASLPSDADGAVDEQAAITHNMAAPTRLPTPDRITRTWLTHAELSNLRLHANARSPFSHSTARSHSSPRSHASKRSI